MRTHTFIAQNVYWRGPTVENSQPDYVCAEFETFAAAAAHAIGLVGQPAPPDAIPDGMFEPHYDVTEYENINSVEVTPIRRWIYEGAVLEEIVEGADL